MIRLFKICLVKIKIVFYYSKQSILRVLKVLYAKIEFKFRTLVKLKEIRVILSKHFWVD